MSKWRKTFPQLRELIDKTLNYYPRIYPKAKYNGSSHTWRFPSGAQIIFGSLNRPQDKIQYQGQAYDFIAFDELTHFTQEEYEYLKSRNRPNGPGTRVYMRATANPGGVGHGWVGELLEQGQFATNVELAECGTFEKRQLAEQLWYMSHDISSKAAGCTGWSPMCFWQNGRSP